MSFNKSQPDCRQHHCPSMTPLSLRGHLTSLASSSSSSSPMSSSTATWSSASSGPQMTNRQSKVAASSAMQEMAVASSCHNKTSSSGVDPSLSYRQLTFRTDPSLLEEPRPKDRRLSRNECEKLRRDRLNTYIGELAKLVPFVIQSTRKVDKATILRLTTTYLRIYSDLVTKKKNKACASQQSKIALPDLANLLLDTIDGFLLVVDTKGVVTFVTESINKYLGHSLTDVLGTSMYKIVHPADHSCLQHQLEVKPSDLKPTNTEKKDAAKAVAKGGKPVDADGRRFIWHPPTGAHVPATYAFATMCCPGENLSGGRHLTPLGLRPTAENDDNTTVLGSRSFCLRMQNLNDLHASSFEMIQLFGHLRSMSSGQNPLVAGGKSSPLGKSGASNSKSRSGVYLIAIAKIERYKPITELYPMLNETKNQWISCHELGGKITFSDERGIKLTGFTPEESIGFSAYSLIHQGDIPFIAALHKHFLSTGEIPQTMFRMYTKSRKILYITNTTHLVVDMWTEKPKYIISINETMGKEEGASALANFHRRVRELTAGTGAALLSVEPIDEDDAPPSASPASHSSASADAVKIVEVDCSKVNVIVGDKEFVIDIGEGRRFDAREHVTRQPDNELSVVFDPHFATDNNQSVPLVEPTFFTSNDDVCTIRATSTEDAAELLNGPATHGGAQKTKVVDQFQLSNSEQTYAPCDNAGGFVESVQQCDLKASVAGADIMPSGVAVNDVITYTTAPTFYDSFICVDGKCHLVGSDSCGSSSGASGIFPTLTVTNYASETSTFAKSSNTFPHQTNRKREAEHECGSLSDNNGEIKTASDSNVTHLPQSVGNFANIIIQSYDFDASDTTIFDVLKA